MYRNGGSLPPRTPDLSRILKALQFGFVRLTLIALSYRGFWTSKGSASEEGIKLDAAATLDYVAEQYPDVFVILWGQSIGAGVATSAAASSSISTSLPIEALILETPFTSVGDMLTAMYPQKWLPYRYLHPFLRHHWDSREALVQLGQVEKRPRVLILVGERDELVPSSHALELESICKAQQIPITRVVVGGALHHEILAKSEGRKALTEFVKRAVKNS